jgi:hypothetical protein
MEHNFPILELLQNGFEIIVESTAYTKLLT